MTPWVVFCLCEVLNGYIFKKQEFTVWPISHPISRMEVQHDHMLAMGEIDGKHIK